MTKFLTAFLALALLVAAPRARAADNFTPAQRAEIIDIIRQAMKTDPSILRDAVTTLQAADEAAEATAQRGKVAQNKAALLNNPTDPFAGNPHGDLTLVEFYDPRCPYCRTMLPAIDAILKQDHGLKLVYKTIPVLGAGSVLESRAILAAQLQGAALPMQAALMTNPAQPTDALIHDTAVKLGLSPEKLARDMTGKLVTQRINANLELAKAIGVQGTPVFIAGSEVIPGAVNQDQLQQVLAQARKEVAE